MGMRDGLVRQVQAEPGVAHTVKPEQSPSVQQAPVLIQLEPHRDWPEGHPQEPEMQD